VYPVIVLSSASLNAQFQSFVVGFPYNGVRNKGRQLFSRPPR